MDGINNMDDKKEIVGLMGNINQNFKERAVQEKAREIGVGYIDLRKIPINPDLFQIIGEEEINAVNKILKSGMLAHGNEVEEFEKEFALDSELKPYEPKNKEDKNYFIRGFIDRFDNLEKIYYDLMPGSGLLETQSEEDFYIKLMGLYQTTSLT